VIYKRLAVTPSGQGLREAVSTAMFAAGAEGLLEEGPAFVSVFEDEAVARAVSSAASSADPDAEISLVDFDPGDWTEAWRSGVRAHQVGRLVVAPPWLAEEHDPATSVIIDPGLGFGTGEHETTRGVLLLLQDVVQAGDVVADVGCGSGVLAIAAVRLGASRAVAIDNDSQAITNAAENVVTNGVTNDVALFEGDAFAILPLVAPIRVVAANIIAPVLLELLPVFDRSLARGGDVVVGGVLEVERDDFVAACQRSGWRVVREIVEGSWWSARLRRVSE